MIFAVKKSFSFVLHLGERAETSALKSESLLKSHEVFRSLWSLKSLWVKSDEILKSCCLPFVLNIAQLLLLGLFSNKVQGSLFNVNRLLFFFV